MKNIFLTMDKLIEAIINPVLAVIGISVAVMLTVGILTRAILGSPMFGLEEIVLFGIMWFYMLGAVLASRERSHLSADFVEVFTHNPKAISIFKVLATLISLVIAILFATWSFDLVSWGIEKQQSTPVFNIPWYLSQGSLFVAAVLFIFYLFRDLVIDLGSLGDSFKN